MASSLLSIEDLKRLFDKCLKELKQEPAENEALYDFSALFDLLSDTTGKLVWSAVRPFMALLANEISELNRVLLPTYGLIDESFRKKVLEESKELINDIASVIDEIGKELCKEGEYDSLKIIELLGKLDKNYLKLIRKRLAFERIISIIRPIPPPPE